MIKLSEYEKKEASRKQKEVEPEIVESRTPEREQNENYKTKDIDYNALDYEDNASEEEGETPKKQVPSLVQYPLPGSFKPIEKPSDGKEEKENLDVPNKRSDALALALGVQIKTGSDPPTGEITISGYDKRNKAKIGDEEKRKRDQELNARLLKMAGQNEDNAQQAAAKEANTSKRNKFEAEKPEVKVERFKNGRVERKRDDRRRFDGRRNFPRRDFDRYRNRNRRSPPRRSRSRERRR